MSREAPGINPIRVQQLECLVTLAEELHFGRTAERLGYTQSRASQLIAALEAHVGARLVRRTSRRVSLTALGEQFVAEVRPSYRSLATTFARARERAMRGALQELTVGFTGMVYEEITRTFRALHDQHEVVVNVQDLPLGSPFSAVLSGEVDAAIAEMPVHESELTVGFRFPAQDQLLAVGLGHPMAHRTVIDVEELAEVDLLHRIGDAPDYWKTARTPAATPSGAPIMSSGGFTSLEQGLTLAATGGRALLVCRPVADRSLRGDLHFVPVHGLERTSQIGLIWRTDRTGPPLPALVELLEDETAAAAARRLIRAG